MSAGPGVHINLCCDISSESGREILSNGRAYSILARGRCVAQTWTLTFAGGITGSSGRGWPPPGCIHHSDPRRAIRFSGYWEALENYAYVDNGFKVVGELGRGKRW